MTTELPSHYIHPGHVVQVVCDTSVPVQVSTSVLFGSAPTGPPQNTEGAEYTTLSITPKSASNILILHAELVGSLNVALGTVYWGFFQDNIANGLATSGSGSNGGAAGTHPMSLAYHMLAGTTSPTIFKIRFGPNVGATATISGPGTGAGFGVGMMSSFVIWEIAA